MTKKLVVLFFLAFIVRLIALNQSLWLDEATSASVATNYNLVSIVTRFSPTDFHPPLYYLFLRSWVVAFGSSEISIRLPSVIFSLLTSLIILKLSNSWATALYLFNPLVIYYSQEARMYSLITLLIIAAYYFFLHHKYLLYNFFVFLSLLTFYGSVFFYLSLFFYLLFTRQFKILLKTLPGFILAAVVLFPLVFHQYQNSRLQLLNVSNWSLVLGHSNLKNLLLIPVKFFFGRISFYPKIVYYAITALWTLFCSAMFINNSKNKFILFLIIFPLILAFIVSFNSPMLQYFRYLYLIPLISIILANSRYKFILLSGFIILSLVYLTNPNFYREDWRSLATSLPANTPVLIVSSFSDPLVYYRHDLHIYDIRSPLLSANDYYVIPYGVDIYNFDYIATLTKSGLVKDREISFRQLSLEHWSRSF